MDFRKGLVGAFAGFLSAVVVDVNAWVKANDKFDWGLAVKRWIAGAVTGFAAGMGIAVAG